MDDAARPATTACRPLSAPQLVTSPLPVRPNDVDVPMLTRASAKSSILISKGTLTDEPGVRICCCELSPQHQTLPDARTAHPTFCPRSIRAMDSLTATCDGMG